jgi:hypothetical protein
VINYLPTTSHELGVWLLFLALGYTIVAWITRRRSGLAISPQVAFDAATFAGSVMLLLGVVSEATLKAIGDTTLFFIIAGIGGLVSALAAL